MDIQVRRIRQNDIPAVVSFLTAEFRSLQGAKLPTLDMLEWKCFDPQGPLEIPRYFVAEENDQIVACIGLCPTQFVGKGLPEPISAGHGIDWFATKKSVSAGLLVGEMMDRNVSVQFSIGGSDRALKLKKYLKEWRFMEPVPVFCRTLRPVHYLKQYRQDVLWKCFAKVMREYARLLVHPSRIPLMQVDLQPVESFGDEVTQIFELFSIAEVRSLRTPELYNHLLRYPTKNISGWHIMQGDRLRGVALLSIVQNTNLRVGKIVDCLMDCLEPNLLHSTLFSLTKKLDDLSAEIVVCYGMTPWIKHALKLNGFYCEGFLPFSIRDPKRLIPENSSFYLTHLEGDHAYL